MAVFQAGNPVAYRIADGIVPFSTAGHRPALVFISRTAARAGASPALNSSVPSSRASEPAHAARSVIR